MKTWPLLFALLALGTLHTSAGSGQTIPPGTIPRDTVYLPLIVAPAPTPSPLPAVDWDPRLDQRGAYLIPAPHQQGPGTWRLVKARWLDEAESGGRHHIYIDTLDETGQRQTGVTVQITWDGGAATVTTEAKPNESYAANYAMYAVAPAYSAQPAGAADGVGGMGLGSLEQPAYTIHTSYYLVWQWRPDAADCAHRCRQMLAE